MDWTDDRLQERLDSIDHRFDEVGGRFDRVDGELKRLDSKIDGLQQTMMLTGGGIIAALIGVIATQL